MPLSKYSMQLVILYKIKILLIIENYKEQDIPVEKIVIKLLTDLNEV